MPLNTHMTCTLQKSLFVLHFLEDLVTLPPRSPTVIVPAVSPSLRASTFLNVSSVCFISSRPDTRILLLLTWYEHLTAKQWMRIR